MFNQLIIFFKINLKVLVQKVDLHQEVVHNQLVLEAPQHLEQQEVVLALEANRHQKVHSNLINQKQSKKNLYFQMQTKNHRLECISQYNYKHRSFSLFSFYIFFFVLIWHNIFDKQNYVNVDHNHFFF